MSTQENRNMLQEIFQMQSELNDIVFQAKGIKNIDGQPMTSEYIGSLVPANPADASIGPNTDTNEWLKKYSWALGDELRELNEELLNKWWSKDKLDVQNIRVEIIDILHFWVSMAITAGMNHDDVYRIYREKHAVNIARQEKGYSKATKDESDNQHIK